MSLKRAMVLVLGVTLLGATLAAYPGSVGAANFAGPGRGVTGNDTGGIFPYTPDVEGIYQQIADGHCGRWGRLAHVTSIHRKYGDYVSFVCIDRPGVIH
jgi:hypothetical protein